MHNEKRVGFIQIDFILQFLKLKAYALCILCINKRHENTILLTLPNKSYIQFCFIFFLSLTRFCSLTRI